MATTYDVVVLGAGPGGYVAAIRAAQLGLKTAIVEKQWWGGVCLAVGCIPSKSLLHNAYLTHLMTHRAAEFGFTFEGLKADYAVAFKRSRDVAEGRMKGVNFLMRKNKIDQYHGWGTFQGPTTLTVALNEGGEQRLEAKNVIIATGAVARLLPGTKTGRRVITYLEQILSDRVPKDIVIIGAGAIGVEFAYVLNAYGTKVTLLEYLPSIVPLEDEDVSKELDRQYRRLGIRVITGARVVSVEETEDEAIVVYEKDGKEERLTAEYAMQAVGWAPREDTYGLATTGVALNARGWIEVDSRMATNVPGVYAIGDATGILQLAHVASAQGIIAAEAIAGRPTKALDYVMMPRCTYCQPQIASFGYTEKQAREHGFDVKVAKFPWVANGKANGLGETAGFLKLVTDAKYGEILGAHLIGPEVTELLPELTLAQQFEMTAAEIGHNVHAHPTLSEALMDLAHVAEGMPINL
ncbi:MAG: dihydrolipoyl dehydrogenase [Chloroflexota bacterium]|nr:dihydrolipoyl dehydrogenase [Dehalococcoidia bacterium]MDW8252613.1 dihydrolipoyl dehydrogenase [Chloroflexota bacterium]